MLFFSCRASLRTRLYLGQSTFSLKGKRKSLFLLLVCWMFGLKEGSREKEDGKKALYLVGTTRVVRSYIFFFFLLSHLLAGQRAEVGWREQCP